MEIRCTATTALPPPLRPWSATTGNQCIFDEIPAHWKKNDAVTFLADIGMYHPSLYQYLNKEEKERERKLTSEYFKRRFIVSRMVLKHILRHIPGSAGTTDIVLNKGENRQITVQGRHDIYLSLSYSGPRIAFTVGKRKIGCDIEVVRPVVIRKIVSSPLFAGYECRDDTECVCRLLQVWTLVEAYAKLRDRNPYPLLAGRYLPSDAVFVSYCIDDHSILTLASDPDPIKDILLWIDPTCMPESSGVGKNPACSSAIDDGGTYVRA